MSNSQVIKFGDYAVLLIRSAIVTALLATCLIAAPTLSAQDRPDERQQPAVSESPYGESPYGPDAGAAQQPLGDYQQDQGIAAGTPGAGSEQDFGLPNLRVPDQLF